VARRFCLWNPAGAEKHPTRRTPPRGGVPAWPGGPAARRGQSQDRLAVLPPVRRAFGRRGIRYLCSPESVYWRGSLSSDTAEGTPPQVGAILVHPRAAPAHVGMV